MTMVTAHDMCLECCQGQLNPDWKIKKPVSFHRFREKPAKQQPQHDPRNRHCAGDEFFRVSTQQPIGRSSPSCLPPRSRSSASSDVSVAASTLVASEQLQPADTRLCGDPSKFIAHATTIQKMQKRAHRVCAVCGKPCHHTCRLCKDDTGKHKDDVPLHEPPSAAGERTCFCQCHNALFCGLAKTDTRLTGAKHKDYSCPSDEVIAEHGNTIKRLRGESTPASQAAANRVNNDGNRVTVANDENTEVEVVDAPASVFVRNGNEHGLIQCVKCWWLLCLLMVVVVSIGTQGIDITCVHQISLEHIDC